MNIKLIAFDIDGTLIPRGKGVIDDITKQALSKLTAKGIKVVVCTGRLLTFMQPDIFATIHSDYYININGATIADSSYHIIKEYPMSEKSFAEVVRAATEKDVAIGLKYAKEIAVYNKYPEFMHTYTKGNKLPDLIFDHSTDKDYHKSHGLPMGAFLIGDNDILKAIPEKVSGLEFVRAYDRAIECYKKGVSKGVALAWVAKRLGIEMSEVMAFGDSDNDIPMIKEATIGIAMGNGEDEVKEAADYVTAACDDLGIVKALKHFEII